MFQGTRKVQFGTGDTWKTINATDEIDCSKGAFGVSKKTKGGICRLDGSEDRVDHNMSICYPLKMNAHRLGVRVRVGVRGGATSCDFTLHLVG